MAADDRANREAALEGNKARVRRYVQEFQSAGNAETADVLVAADIPHHHGPAWTLVDTTGREGAKQFITWMGLLQQLQATPSTKTSSH
jgi:hypothetical protein